MLVELTRSRDDTGTGSLELVILAPFIVLLLLLILLFGRFANTESLVDQAARDAARAATAQNSAAQARSTIDSVTADVLRDGPPSCRRSARDSVAMTANAFGLPDPNNPTAIDSVTVTVTCTVDLSDLAPLPLKSITLTRTFTSPLDKYRGYQ